LKGFQRNVSIVNFIHLFRPTRSSCEKCNYIYALSQAGIEHAILRWQLGSVVLLGPAKRRVMKWRVISESYDFGESCSNHAQTTPTFPNDHTQFLNSPDVSLNWLTWESYVWRNSLSLTLWRSVRELSFLKLTAFTIVAMPMKRVMSVNFF
jgi:hypothetical protein